MRLARFLNTSFLDLADQPLTRLEYLLNEAGIVADEIEEARKKAAAEAGR